MVIPALNEAQTLPRLLESLADEADEVVVVDGGSSDGSQAIAREHGARVLLTDRGRGRQLAAGARATEAELLIFLHADCVLEPGSLAAVCRAFEDQDLIAGGMHQLIEGERAVFRWIESAANRRVRRHGMVYGDSGLVVRRSAYLAAGGFPVYPIFEDVELSRNLIGLGRVVLIPGATIRISSRRWDREGVVRCTARNWLLRAAFLFGLEPHRLARHYEPEALGSGGPLERDGTSTHVDATEPV